MHRCVHKYFCLAHEVQIQDNSGGTLFLSLIAFLLGLFSPYVKGTWSPDEDFLCILVQAPMVFKFFSSLLKRKLIVIMLLLLASMKTLPNFESCPEIGVDGISAFVGIIAVPGSTSVAGFTAFDGLPTVEYGLLLYL